MGKNKFSRELGRPFESQEVTENINAKKFSESRSLSKESKQKILKERTPQLVCTIFAEEKLMLKELILHCSNRDKQLISCSAMVRALIRLGDRYKSELHFSD